MLKNISAKVTGTVSGLVLALGGSYYLSILERAHASEALEPPKYPWNHKYPWQAFDHASIRRGFQVYRQVCSTCHSLDKVAYRNLIDACYTEEEVKEIAAQAEFQDGPDQEGEMFTRPGRLSDYMPRPYANSNVARFTNNGALPPDLSLMVKARHDREDYIFSLLTGYREAPAGINMRSGLYYNPYFPGGAIAMPQALIADAVTYDDGTESSISQMAKDVSIFLAWASEPEADDRKKAGLKALFIVALMAVPTFYYKRLRWSVLKSRIISFTK